MTKVAGRCPMGCGETLIGGNGGHVTCSLIGCPKPWAAVALLNDPEWEQAKAASKVECVGDAVPVGQAARYREALAEGKLTAYMVAPKGFSDEKREAWDFAVYEAEQFIARALREASLGGDDDCLDPEQAFGAVQSGPDEADD